jgi:hypothetical protein
MLPLSKQSRKEDSSERGMESVPGAVATGLFSSFPLPLGEGQGEGLGSAHPMGCLSLNATRPQVAQIRNSVRPGPHPQPFSQREKGEKPLSPSTMWRAGTQHSILLERELVFRTRSLPLPVLTSSLRRG